MSGANDASAETQNATPSQVTAANASPLPVAAGLLFEIPKPRDWSVFQRFCVVLFECELGDPHTMEYGRAGQLQNGIDIIGKRNCNPAHYVGIQCRLIVQPITQAKILSDCHAALQINAGLKEIIFATTAPDDRKATDAAIAVERQLAQEGHTLSVVVYGWGALQNKIAMHPRAHQVFHPGAFMLRDVPLTDASLASAIASGVAAALEARQSPSATIGYISDGPVPDLAAEDPVLHARIDAIAELLGKGQPKLAEEALLKLLDSGVLAEKPAARYRVLANLGSAAIDLGREVEAAERFEAAHALRPTDGRALAFLALARTMQKRFTEGMGFAEAALHASPRADHAVGYLLQAAARSDWQGDPETLVPEDLRSSSHAALGLAEFWRRRDIKGWEERVIALAEQHLDVEEIRNSADMAVLSLALAGSDIIGMGGRISADAIDKAAEHALKHAESLLNVGFVDEHDLAAHVNNAALLLRLADRDKDAAALLRRCLTRVKGQPALARLCALTLAAIGERAEALIVLEVQGYDPQNALLGAEMKAADGALGIAIAIPPIGDPAIDRMRLRVVSELAASAKDAVAAQTAVDGLRGLDPNDPLADVAEGRRRNIVGEADDQVRDSFIAAAAKLRHDSDLATRFVVAEAMAAADLDSEAADLLAGYVNLDRIGAASMLYLESLATARRDVAFQQAILQASEELRSHLTVLRLRAAHAWNCGDLKTCRTCVDATLERDSGMPWARLMRMELMVREDRAAELLEELRKPVEDVIWTRLADRMRIAVLLGHMGFSERAAALAYRIFLENRDVSSAWMTLSSVVLNQGLVSGSDRIWLVETVSEHAAVDVSFKDGPEFFIVEPDAALRRLDAESWEPSHALVVAALGLKQGDEVSDAKGRVGRITQVRHKYVARLHQVMEEHEERFPSVTGFQKVRVAPDEPDGLDDFKERLREIREYGDEQVELWKTNLLPLGWLAQRLGTDEIDLSAGLAGDKIKLKVAHGRQEERDAAMAAIQANGLRGCVLDLMSFWTAWRLKSLDSIEALCGPIAVPQSVVDHLRRRAEKLEFHAANGALRMAGYEGGKISITETSAELVRELAADTKSAVAWIEARGAARPMSLPNDMDADLLDLVRNGHTHVFDGVVLAKQLDRLLICDDLPTRAMATERAEISSVWSDQVARAAANAGVIDLSTSVKWSAHLVAAGHDYVGTAGDALAEALRIDVTVEGKPGYHFKTLAGVLGGARAESASHTRAAVEALARIWADDALADVREPATGILLECLLSARPDWSDMLMAVYQMLGRVVALREYMDGWVRGHFLLAHLQESKA